MFEEREHRDSFDGNNHGDSYQIASGRGEAQLKPRVNVIPKL